jgi:hypothetical protein
MPDVDDLPPVLDERNQPVLIAADVKYREITDSIGVREVSADIGQMIPCRPPGDSVPVKQRRQCIVVPFAEFDDCCLADDPHYV